jgi:RHS repeat-associated protein
MRAFAFLRVVLFFALFTSIAARPAWADRPSSMSPRTIALPSGPASMKGLGESFAPNPSTGVGNFSIPIDLPPGLARPSLAIQYTSGKGRSDVGASFHIPVLQVYRTRDKGSPAWNESDRFAVSSGDLNDELVLVNDEKHYYRLKNEGAFALFVRDPREDTWTIRMPNGDRAFLGTDERSRQYSTRHGVYKWFVRAFEDAFGDRAEYDYETDEGYVYLTSIRYQLHAAGYENAVEITRENRQDPFTDYGYGSASRCRKRVSRIEVYSGCGLGCRRLLRTYALEYEQTTTSLLSSVQMYGEGGSAFTPTGDTMPPLRFSYVPASRALGRTVAMPQSLPLDLVSTGRAQFDDVNGDGLPDLLVGEARNYSYYENRTGYAWSDPNTLARSPDVSLDDESNGATLADVDGDGFRDVLRSSTQGYTYYPGGNVQGSRFMAYLPPVAMGGAANFAMRWTDPSYRLADLNFDGRTDLLTTNGPRAVSLLNIAAFGQEGLQTLSGGNLPQDVARLWSDPSLQMLDFNGDGTQDFVANEISWGSDSRFRVFYGLGEGAYLDPKVIAAPKGNPGDFFLVDLNNDGYTDLLKYSGQQIVYWLGAGDDRLLGPYGPNYAWSAPSRADVRSVQFMDMDGSGTVDLVLLTKANKVVYVNIFTSPSIGLLSKIDNGIGMITEIAYRSSTDYATEAKLAGRPWRTTLPKPVAVISEVKVTDSLDRLGLPAQVQRTTFEYGEGYYDGKEREFRGFGYVKLTSDGDDHAEARVTETWMSVGKDPVTGEDQEILKGKPLREIVSDGNGGVYTSSETKWELGWLCAEDSPELHDVLPRCALYPNKVQQKDHLVARAFATASLHGTWEKTTTPKYTLERRIHDVWGTATRTIEYGEVAFRAPRNIGDPFAVEDVDPFVGDDERVEVSQVIYDIDRWMIGALARTEVRDARTDALLGATELYYDGAPFEGLPLGQIQRGKVSRNRRWLAEQNRFIDGMRFAHDAHGQVNQTLDPIGNHGSIEFDAATGTFPVREVVDLPTGSLVFEATYDTGLGAVLSSTDPNGARTQYRYDGLGRMRAIIDAQSTADLPSLTYDYEYGTPENPVSTVIERHLIDRTQQSYRNVWHYSDGLGRARLAKVAGAAPGTYIATGWIEYSPSGAEANHFEEYATTSLGLEPPPATTPRTESTYDALGRIIDVFPTATGGGGRTFFRTRYLPFETHVFDEEDTSEGTWLYPSITRTDGQGRIRDIVKYNDYATAPGGSRLRTELKWSFRYNDSGSVTSWTDPKGVGRNYSYDSIGRLVDLHDPNLGPIHYAYDDANNLVRRVDALGQERHYEYGSGNRLLNVSIRKDAHGAPDYDYKYHYDAADPRGPLATATNLKGRLAWVEWPTGSAHFSFDTLGRAVKETQSLWDPERSVFEQQTRDVFTKERDYDAAGDVLRTRLPGGRTFAATYDARGLLQSLSSTANNQVKSLVSGVQYDLEGKVRRTENGNGTVGCAWYNARSETVAVAAGPRTALTCDEDPTHKIQGTFQHLTYGRGVARTIDRVTDLSVDGNLPRLDAEYTYDRLHELTWARSDKGTDSYEYDAIQNLIRHTSTVPNAKAVVGDLTYAENGAGPSMVTRAGGTSYTYDAVGNLRAYNGYTLEWNAENKLVAARKPGGPTIHYHYDFAGERRITVVERPGKAPEVHREIFDEYQSRNGEDVWIVGAGHTGVEITQRPGEAEEIRYAHKDHLTGTTHLTDASGTLVGFQQYGPYGDVLTRIGSKPMLHGFAGSRAEADEDLGLVRFGARYYAPALAHWASADTFIGEAPDKILKIPLETNLYGYASNNPISLIDPLGADAWYESAWDWGSKFTVGVAKGAYGAAKETVQGAVQVVTHPIDTAVAVYDAGREVVRDPVGSAKRAATGIYNAGAEVVDTIASGDPDRIGQLGGKVLFEVGATVVGAKVATATSGIARAAVSKVGRGALAVARAGGSRIVVAAAEAAPKIIAKAGEGVKRISRVCNGHCGLPGGTCFLGGTLVHVPGGLAPIESLALGQRVLTMEADDEGETEVDATWRVVQLEMANPDGSDDILAIDVLRSPAWIREHGFVVGEWVDFVLDDMGIRGLARVVAILSPPPIEPGPGRIITATVTHENAYMRELVLRDSGEAIQLTDSHRLYSADRGAWVAAVDLEEGERVWTRDGTDAIASSTALIGRFRVYNLEVDSKHEYLVSRAGVRSHNTGACRQAAKAAMKKMGLEGINLAKKSFNSGRKMLEKAGFELAETTETGRKVFRNAKTGAEVYYDSGDALVGAQKPHWHIRDKGGMKYDRSGRVVSGSENAGHIPAQ